MTGNIVQSAYSRPWLLKGGPGPGGVITLVECAKALDPSWGQGDVSKIECPSFDQYGEFEEADEIQGARDRVTSGIMGRYDFEVSELLTMVRERCPFDFYVLLGKCKNPNTPGPDGWQKMQIYPKSRFTEYGIENLGAIESGERNPTNENVPISAAELYEVVPVNFTEHAASTIAREIVSVDICDDPSCGGDCGPNSTGCDKIIAVEIGTGATPGTLPRVVYSKNGGNSWSTANITTMFSNETPTDSDCVGSSFVVLNETSNSIHYVNTADLMAGSPVWTEVTTGFVAGATPQAIWSRDGRHTWIAAALGYIYFMSDPSTGVTVQDAGQATTQTLRDIHAYDNYNVVAVGANNAVIKTTDGQNWTAVTGPVPGVGINTVWMHSKNVWEIGDANGALWYTEDAGVSWTQVTLPGSLTAIDKIRYTNRNVGWLTGRSSAAGVVLRNPWGGAPDGWYVLPEGAGSIPSSAGRQNDIATCADPNIAWVAGLGSGTDGMLLEIS